LIVALLVAFNEQGIVGESFNLTAKLEALQTHAQTHLEWVQQQAQRGQERLSKEVQNVGQSWQEAKQSICPQGLTQCGKDVMIVVTDQRIFNNGANANQCIRNKEFFAILLSALCWTLFFFK
jgi:hypothetical protein